MPSIGEHWGCCRATMTKADRYSAPDPADRLHHSHENRLALSPHHLHCCAMQHSQPAEASTLEIIGRAIQATRMISATYNGAKIELCPHELFMRHQSVYLKAYNPNKSRKHDEEATLGKFSVAGLSHVIPSSRQFSPLPLFAVASGQGEQSIVSVIDSQ